MSENNNKEILTIEDILKRKKFFEEKRKERKTLYVKSIDANVVIEKPSKELMFEIDGMNEEESDSYAVYSCIVEPDLHDEKIQNMYKGEIEQPWDVLYKIMDPMEVAQIAVELGKLAGYGGVKDVSAADTIKNELKK